jgi:ketosteroid isomerase-like protein
VPALVLLVALAPPLYRLGVGAQIRRLFASLNRHDWSPVTANLASEFTYEFHGDTAIGGVRRRRETVDAWFERVFRVLPDARFELRDVVVGGPPWNTRVAIHASIAGNLADGTPYSNVFQQRVVVRWAKVRSIETIEDTQKLDRAMRALAASGFEEAVAAPLVD